jgi:hypothetical protein
MLPIILVYSAENTTSNPYLPSSKMPPSSSCLFSRKNGGKYRRKINGGKYCRKYRRKLPAENTAENTGGKHCI